MAKLFAAGPLPVIAARFLWPIALSVAYGQPQPARQIGYGDLPAPIAARFEARTFAARIAEIERETDRREREGELDHLIYYALQSQRFTGLPRIEPALSAKECTETGTVPPAVRRRLNALLRALRQPGSDERLRYFAALLKPQEPTTEFLEAEYRRAMRFLYDKEFLRREHVYETRGYSTDTQAEANYAVWNALSVLRSLEPQAAIRQVLIVGPGLDFAPRTALVDALQPQSFQPYASADALFSLGLSKRGELRIDCADINARVLDFIQRFPAGDRRLELYSEARDPDYARYFHALGNAIGTAESHRARDPLPASYLAKTVQVSSDVARAVRAAKLNILTQRWNAGYDAAIATNVLLYFDSDELALALANVAAMLRPGGYFIHNELRGEFDQQSDGVGLSPLQARTVQVGQAGKAPLYDAFAIYVKRFRK